MKPSILESLEKAEQMALMLSDDLREAYRDAGPLLSLAMRPVINDTAELHKRIREVLVHASQEHDGPCDDTTAPAP